MKNNGNRIRSERGGTRAKRFPGGKKTDLPREETSKPLVPELFDWKFGKRSDIVLFDNFFFPRLSVRIFKRQ